MAASIPELLEEALAYHRGGHLADAERLYREILAIDAHNADALHLLGAIAHQVGKNDIAVAFYSRAIELNAGEAAYHSNLGIALQALNRLDEALASYDTALRLKPDYAEAHSNRGMVLKVFERLDEALASYDTALRIKPDSVEAHANRGSTLSALGRVDEALASFEAAIRIRPDFIKAHSNLIFDLHYRSAPSETTIKSAVQRFASHYSPVSPTFANARTPERGLRIGYVSGDFGRHSVSYFLVQVLTHRDHEAFEIFCYPTRDRQDDMTAKLRATADHWQSLVGLSDQAAEERIRADGIDILVDLSGHTAHNRLALFARKPAPLQVTWLGYPGTTGLSTIDYRLVDAITDPEDDGNGWTSETLLRLPNGFLCFDPPAEAPDVAAPPCGDGTITFGSFNNPAKLSDATLDVWAALMARVPGARLLIKGRPFRNQAAQALLLERLKTRGVPADRVSLHGWETTPGGHLGLYGQVDIALDPFPYNGTTTTCEALWMGVPVVTLEGTRHSGRVGASLLTQVGLQELIAADVEEYVRIAADLAADRKRLGELRSTLRHRVAVSPLCDAEGFARKLEHTYRTIWRKWCFEDSGKDCSTEEIFAAAVQKHQAGQFAEAEHLYNRVLASNALHADALHLLGVLAHQMGRNSIAVELISKAIEIDGAAAHYHSNLGIALKELGRLDEAIASYGRALHIRPDYPEAQSNLGITLKELGCLEEAVTAYKTAICIKPDYPEAYSNLGNLLRVLGSFEKAVALYKAAIFIKPNYPEAYSNFGAVLKELKRLNDAVSVCKVATLLKPDYAGAHSNLGSVLADLGQIDEAITAYNTALQLNPDNYEACSNLGMALQELGRIDDAVAAFEMAIRLKPDFAEAHSNLLLTLHYGTEAGRADILSKARRFGAEFERGGAARSYPNNASIERRLRIGYVSGDFGR